MIFFKIFTCPPYFGNKYTFPPIFAKCLHFPLCSFNFRFLASFKFFLASSYFDHDAFMHHALHVLDALPLSKDFEEALYKF